jgi:hypothetical protein
MTRLIGILFHRLQFAIIVHDAAVPSVQCGNRAIEQRGKTHPGGIGCEQPRRPAILPLPRDDEGEDGGVLADLQHLVLPGLPQRRGDELGADVAFA